MMQGGEEIGREWFKSMSLVRWYFFFFSDGRKLFGFFIA